MDVLLIAPSPPPSGGMALQARQLERLLREDGHQVTFCPSNYPFPDRLRAVDRVRGLRTVLRTLVYCWNLPGLIRKVQVVHILAASWLYFFLVVAPAVILGHRYGKRVVLNYRGGQAERFFAGFCWAARPVFRRATVITAPSEFLATVIRKYFDLPVRIVPNVLDLSVFRHRLRPAPQPKLLVTRHLEKIYDVESVLRAFQAVQQHYSDASLEIAGTGTQKEYLCRLVSDWNLRNVSFHGHVRHNTLAALHDQCDIFINASLVDNFPGSLIEASASGLVIISTGAGGIPFLYEHGKNALLVEPGDWQALARAVERVLRNPGLALDLSREAVALARSFDWKEVRKPLYEAYGVSSFEVHEEDLHASSGQPASRS